MTGDRLALDLMVVGAQKSATSSLVAMLHTAPRTAANPSGAEVSYFVDDAQFARGPGVALAKYFSSPPGSGELRIGKSAGLMYNPTALARLAADSPGVRAVALLREPVARAYSAWLWAARAGVEPDTFPDAVERELAGRDVDLPRPWLRRHVDHGEYARHLDRVREVLGADRVEVLTMEQFVADGVGCVNALLAPFGREITAETPRAVHTNRSTGVRSPRLARLMRSPAVRAPLRRVLPPGAQRALSRTAMRANDKAVDVAPLDPDTRARLAEHFRPWNARLEEQLGRELGWDDPGQGRPSAR